jgi:hypothetical protein
MKTLLAIFGGVVSGFVLLTLMLLAVKWAQILSAWLGL